MGKFFLDIPDELHDILRHYSIDTKKDMKDIIIESIAEKICNKQVSSNIIPRTKDGGF